MYSIRVDEITVLGRFSDASPEVLQRFSKMKKIKKSPKVLQRFFEGSQKNLCRTSGEPSENLWRTFGDFFIFFIFENLGEPSENLRRTFGEPSENLRRTSGEPSENLPRTVISSTLSTSENIDSKNLKLRLKLFIETE